MGSKKKRTYKISGNTKVENLAVYWFGSYIYTNKSKDDLQGIISIWHEAVKLHDFFASIERQIASATDHRKEHLLERARIAKELAGAIDPLSHLAVWKTPDEVAVLMRKKRRETYWHDDYDDLDEISQGD